MNEKTIQKAIACSLSITNNALKGIEQWFPNEQTFISSENAFDIHIEKKPLNRKGNHSYAFFFDPQTNPRFARKVDERVAVMDCVLKPDGLLATGFHVRGKKEPVRTNRRLQVLLDFKLNRSGISLPSEIHTKLQSLPIAEERSEYVKKRIESWEGYLQIEEKNADVEDINCTFTNASFTNNFTKVRLACKDLQAKNWKQLKGFSVKLTEQGSDIGKIIEVNKRERVIEVELGKQMQRVARTTNRLSAGSKKLTLSNFAALSQVRRLRKGFKDLQDGLAANANLEKILFEERPVVMINNKNPELEFHNTLNAYQQEAVTGAMKAHDLYVIQGPPGTGKTTVISEICYQNVKAGLRTLVASQSNLAVDNALGRLLADPAIRILRYGRTESIEEEGRKFIEENVALHWRDATLSDVGANIQELKDKIQQLHDEITHLRTEIEKNQSRVNELQQQQIVQEKLQLEISELAAELELNQAELKVIQDQLTHSCENIRQHEQQLQTVTDKIVKIKAFLDTNPNEQALTQRRRDLQEELNTFTQWLEAMQVKQELLTVETAISDAVNRIPVLKEEQAAAEQLKEQLPYKNKLSDLQQAFEDNGFELPIDIILDISELNRVGKDTAPLPYTLQDLKQLHDRFSNAIQKTEQLLTQHRFPLDTIAKRATTKYDTVPEMQEMIDRLGYFLIDPTTKQALQHSAMTPDKVTVLQKIAKGLSLFYGKLEAVREMGNAIHEQTQLRQQVKRMYTAIKKDSLAFLTNHMTALSNEEMMMLQQQQELADKKQSLNAELAKRAAEPAIDLDEIEVKSRINETEVAIKECDDLIDQLKRKTEELSATKQLVDQVKSTLEQEQQINIKLLQDEEKLQQNLDVLHAQDTDLRDKLNPSILSDLEALKEQMIIDEKQVIEWQTEQEQLPMQLALKEEWEPLLKEASAYDLDEIRKLYVEHANVIGTTCVASAAKTFMEDYPTFDVVIIDEVSKATPPELLLPMLKGKKVILVGDHHQLPPLVGQETMDEFLNDQDTGDQQELKKLLNESLFERLFRTLPKQNKTMLSIQYRMHERIMETISPFYKEGSNQLQCGLPDSDAVRDHLLESSTIKRDDHLLWLDTPNEPAYFEDKPKGGTSRFNESELDLIRNLLKELELATQEAIAAGRMDQSEKKSVGIISFYGEQVKRINHLIEQDLRPKYLHCRTGSVDKFQGMEMDVIILSFVRNHKEPSGEIGFAKDYRRLNVALSRSRELLIIIGSSEMFTARTKHSGAKEMYSHLLETVKQNGGLKNVT